MCGEPLNERTKGSVPSTPHSTHQTSIHCLSHSSSRHSALLVHRCRLRTGWSGHSPPPRRLEPSHTSNRVSNSRLPAAPSSAHRHSARILATLLPASAIATLLSPMQHCTFTDQHGQELLRFTCQQHRSHRLHSDYIIDQPALERALRARFVTHPNITFIQGDTLTAIQERVDGKRHTVYVTTAAGCVLSADYVLACDGARSTVRMLLDIPCYHSPQHLPSHPHTGGSSMG